MIEVKNLVKKYGSHAAVNDLSFTVETGKVVGFLGPNGAGKSTTMNMITGYIAPTEGEILIDGIDIMDEPELAKKNIGYLPEIPPLYPDLRVREYLSFVADLKKVPKKERDIEVHKIMSKTKTLDVSERLIKHLSKGYKQRVGLAGAMIGNPDILILDEPTVGLDPSQIIEMRELIRELSKNHTVLLSSHIMQEISAVCDEIIIINEGKMITKDTPENITKKMVDTNGVHIIVKGDKTKLKEALRTVSGIKNVSYDNEKDNENDNEKETIGLTIYCAEDEDIRVELFYALAKAECPVIEMNKLDTSLEDAFLALTKGGSKQYGGRKLKKLKSGHKNEKENSSDGDIEQQDINNDEQSTVEKTDEERQVETDESLAASSSGFIIRRRRIMLAIYKKELRQYFNSMIGFVFLAFFLVIIGIYTWAYNFSGGLGNFEVTLGGISFMYVLLIPILTMRIVAEENRQKTDQLLYTAPISLTKIIIGKYFAVMTLFSCAFIPICIYPLIIHIYGTDVRLAPAYSSIIGFYLLGAATIAIGLFISSLTESQVIASVVSFITLLLTFLLSNITSLLPTDAIAQCVMIAVLWLVICFVFYHMMNNVTILIMMAVIGEAAIWIVYAVKSSLYESLLTNILNTLALSTRYDDFSLGILNYDAIVYYVSIAFLFVFLTIQMIKKKRFN